MDIIFLDINLPDISGIHYVRTLVNPPHIIITTAYHEHAVESFELDAICDYLVKPFSFERFIKAINKTKKTSINFRTKEISDSSSEVVFLNIDKTLHKVNLADIVYIESNRNYISITTTKGKWTYIDSLKNWMEKLSKENFIQVHKSFIVNHKRIDKVSGNLLYLENKKVPIGRLYKGELLKKLNFS